VLDFFDTFFIVARGKWDQFSFLHCYHHLSIFLTYWCVVRGRWACGKLRWLAKPTTSSALARSRRLVTVAAYDGDVYYTIIANSLVHAVMYLYYFLTCFNIRPSCVPPAIRSPHCHCVGADHRYSGAGPQSLTYPLSRPTTTAGART
jgi:hypothetical protein